MHHACGGVLSQDPGKRVRNRLRLQVGLSPEMSATDSDSETDWRKRTHLGGSVHGPPPQELSFFEAVSAWILVGSTLGSRPSGEAGQAIFSGSTTALATVLFFATYLIALHYVQMHRACRVQESAL